MPSVAQEFMAITLDIIAKHTPDIYGRVEATHNGFYCTTCGKLHKESWFGYDSDYEAALRAYQCCAPMQGALSISEGGELSLESTE